MNKVQQIISGVSVRLYTFTLLKSLVAGGSAFFLAQTFLPSIPLAFTGAFAAFLLTGWFAGLFRNNRQEAVSLIHKNLGATEYSLDLLDKPTPNIAEQLQLERLALQAENMKTPVVFNRSLLYFLAGLTVAFSAFLILPAIQRTATDIGEITYPGKPGIAAAGAVPPVFSSARLTITPPSYTGMPVRSSEDLNASAIAGSALKWDVRFSHHENLDIQLSNSRGEERPFRKNNGLPEYRDQLTGSGLYSLKAYWKDSLIYQSEYYHLEAIPDLAPKIEPDSKELYRFHFLKDPMILKISAKISDDFQVNQAFIVATLARGSGENVKFREVRFPLQPSRFKSAALSKIIDLKALNFAPGDELYYYWAAVDNRSPEPNFSKSDTYFVVYKDTAATEEGELATMAMNILPEYFRSQRQIIIDTEKLIARRKKLPPKEFNSISNEIGFDQKALRLRYGQYLGEEFENSIGGGAAMPSGADHHDPAELLKGFTHAHDEGEHDTEPGGGHDHGHSHGAGTAANEDKDPLAAMLEAYVHSHDDGEANTYYEASTRSLLKMALEQMWQSELHLRLYEPEKAIPYEQKALEFLKSAQHKARTYVKKSGFDPPPIKEKEKRMTGELTRFNDRYSSARMLTQPQAEKLAAEVLGIAERYFSGIRPDVRQKQQVLTLGNYLGTQVRQVGAGNVSLFGSLQKLLSDKPLDKEEAASLRSGLYRMAGSHKPGGLTRDTYLTEPQLEKAFRKNLQ